MLTTLGTLVVLYVLARVAGTLLALAVGVVAIVAVIGVVASPHRSPDAPAPVARTWEQRQQDAIDQRNVVERRRYLYGE